MGFDLPLRQFMTQTITVYPRTGHNSYGEATFGSTGVTYQCRIAGTPRWVRNQNAEIVEITDVVWVGSTGTITEQDRIELADGSTPPVIRVEKFPDQNGHHHTKITFGYLGGRRRS